MPHIEIAAKIIIDAALIPDHERKAVEESKDKFGIDDTLADFYVRRMQVPGGPLPDRGEVLDLLYYSLDAAIALWAYCTDEDQITYVYERAVLVGSQHRGKIRLNRVQLSLKLRKMYRLVADQANLPERDKQGRPIDKILVRRKTRATLAIINQSINHRGTR